MLTRSARAAAVGAGSFAIALLTAVLCFLAVQAVYRPFDAIDAGTSVRRALAWGATSAAIAPALFVLLALPLLLARRLHLNPLLSILVAAVLAGLAADWLLNAMSAYNGCWLDYEVPYQPAGCS